MTSPSTLQIVLIAFGVHAAGSLLLIKVADADCINPLHHLRAAAYGHLLAITTFPAITTPSATPPDRRTL
ncbi:hypothetical protein ACFRFJ_15615 [Streptomyces hydrogenans]|uniref:hypothetical protein n=1 Tax=Streptomyces hydrogenans TaxID=1873719 RepID=UPI00369A12E5